jgi:hypothetical protein
VHNTLTVNGQEQMTWAGRFLWLDWAQAKAAGRETAEDGAWERLEAEHDGYRRQGVRHLRRVTGFADGRWEIQDQLLRVKAGSSQGEVTVRLHWLLLDGDWGMENGEPGTVSGEQRVEDTASQVERSGQEVRLQVNSIYGWIGLKVLWPESVELIQVQLARAGELLYGAGPVDPTWGWVSPTYGVKLPALSLSVTVKGKPPFGLTSEFVLPCISS